MAHKRKIVTVFLLSAAAGCGTTSTPARESPTAATDVPVPVTAPAGTVATAAATATIDPAAVPAPTRRPFLEADLPKEIVALRAELYSNGSAAAQANPARFRALCDREGYPLVGNVANKGAMYTVREHCAAVRKAAQS